MKKIIFLLLISFSTFSQVEIDCKIDCVNPTFSTVTSPTVYGGPTAASTLNLMGSSSATPGVVAAGSSTASSFIARGTSTFVGTSTFSSSITSPTVYGSSSGGSNLTLSANSTATPGTIYIAPNGSTVQIGVTSVNGSTMGIVSIAQGSCVVIMGERGTSGQACIWLGTSLNFTPTTSNYFGYANGTANNFNGSNSANVNVNGNTKIGVNGSGMALTGTVSTSSTFTVASTLTAAGLSASTKTIDATAGDAVTINGMAGRFRKDTSGSTFTLTNSQITANSIVIVTFASDPGITGYDAPVVACGSGSATITFKTNGVAAAPTANTDVNFIVVN